MAGRLSGRCILITRPQAAAEKLERLIRAEGGEPLVLPAIEILPPADRGRLAAVIGNLSQFDLAVFISPTAAERGVREVRAVRGWPEGLRVAAVGAGTASALRELGFAAVIAPPGRGDSEALAALPELQALGGKSVVIFRGEGGRERLREALAARGASVTYAECYRRGKPSANPGALLERWRGGGVDAASVTSREGLENLLALIGQEGTSLLASTPVFVPHPRIAEAAAALGLRRVVTVEAGDEALVRGLAAFFARV